MEKSTSHACIVECQVLNVKRGLELGDYFHNHHDDWITNESSMCAQYKMKFGWGTGYLHGFKLSHKLLISYKDEKKYSE